MLYLVSGTICEYSYTGGEKLVTKYNLVEAESEAEAKTKFTEYHNESSAYGIERSVFDATVHETIR
jgi:hypothetical protein